MISEVFECAKGSESDEKLFFKKENEEENRIGFFLCQIQLNER